MRRENKDLFRAEELYCKKYSSQEMRPRNRSQEIYFIRCCGCEQQGSSGMVRGVGFLHNIFSSRCSRSKTLLLRLGETARIISKPSIIKTLCFVEFVRPSTHVPNPDHFLQQVRCIVTIVPQNQGKAYVTPTGKKKKRKARNRLLGYGGRDKVLVQRLVLRQRWGRVSSNP